MTEIQAHTVFIDALDRATLEKINERISVLEPIVAEYRELRRRRTQLETRYGLNRTSEKMLTLLADYPEGLTTKKMADILELQTSTVRSTASDLVKRGLLVRLTPGLFGYATSPETSE